MGRYGYSRRRKYSGESEKIKSVKRAKRVAEHFERYIGKSRQFLGNQEARDIKLIEELKEEVSFFDLMNQKLSKLDSARRQLHFELLRLKQTKNTLNAQLRKIEEYEQKTTLSRFFSAAPFHTKAQVIQSLDSVIAQETIKKSSEEKVSQEFCKEANKLPHITNPQKQLPRLRKSSLLKISNAELRLEATKKAILYIQEQSQIVEQIQKDSSDRLQKYKAYKAALFDKSRQLGKETRKSLSKQAEIITGCPYCGCDLDTEIHADHIYPVSKGGLSTVSNMVLVCKDCNLSKSGYTLREFIQRKGLNREVIEYNLSKLNKDF